ncbi:MAG: hypothetical protein ACM31L_16155 [Actinomycetota bacterium]
MTLRLARTLAVLLAAPVALSACAMFDKKEPPPCPPVYILSDAATVTKFRDGPGRDLTDVDVEAEVVGYKGDCSYDEKGAKVNLQVTIEAKRGPANSKGKSKLSYFVAIPHFYPSPQAKAVFPVEVEFPDGTNQVRYTDEAVSMRIPVKTKDLIDKFEIYLGFQTSQEELDMNRKVKH